MPRKLEELFSDASKKENVYVSAEEARILAVLPMCSISSGARGGADGESWQLEQRYEFRDHTFKWLQGLLTRDIDEPYPV